MIVLITLTDNRNLTRRVVVDREKRNSANPISMLKGLSKGITLIIIILQTPI